mmetsp:Transcript_53250/g.124629  ORF Transcript_53250/g.124629 Transcript_53250/m.124629 type:complete len:149 (+) Transcript_53250:59-505(+)
MTTFELSPIINTWWSYYGIEYASVEEFAGAFAHVLAWTVIGAVTAYLATYAGCLQAIDERKKFRTVYGAPYWRESTISTVLPRRLDVLYWSLIPITEILVPGCVAVTALTAAIGVANGVDVEFACGIVNFVAFTVMYGLAYAYQLWWF